MSELCDLIERRWVYCRIVIAVSCYDNAEDILREVAAEGGEMSGLLEFAGIANET